MTTRQAITTLALGVLVGVLAAVWATYRQPRGV